MRTTLAQAVFNFAQATRKLSDADLERDYTWRYHDEGLRFALIGTYHELRDLAATTAAERAAYGHPISIAQRVLGQYHLAYRELQASLLGADDALASRTPAPGEWPIWVALWHMIETEQSFFPRCRYAVDQMHAGAEMQVMSNDERWALLAEEPETDPARLLRIIYGDAVRTTAEEAAAPLPSALHGSFFELLEYYDTLHHAILSDLATLTDAETLAPSLWWEDEPIPVRYRLHRFDAHLRQHSIQVEKTLAALEQPPTEAERLLRLVYAALAEAEGAALGSPHADTPAWHALADTIVARTVEIGRLLAT